jgi:hypothetical protein
MTIISLINICTLYGFVENYKKTGRFAKALNVYMVGECCLDIRGVSRMFQADVLQIIKLTIRPTGRHNSRSRSLPRVDTDPTAFTMFGTLPGSPYLSEYHAPSAIRLGSPQGYQTGVISASISFLEIGRSQRVPNQGRTVGGGWQLFCISPETEV